MTNNYDALRWHSPYTNMNALNWLYNGNQPLGHMHPVSTDFKDEAIHGTYAVSVWIPREVLITRLPADLTMDEARDAAKVLIVLRLKEAGML
jgi:hypothetical protein